MLVQCDEIFVGERNRSMGVLSTSLPQNDARQFAHHLDLPGQPPQGFDLNTYVSGAPINGHYVIARTSDDPLSERSGMVFSHALVFKIDAIEHLKNIRPVFQALLYKKPLLGLTASRRTLSGTNSVEKPPPGNFCDKITARSASVLVTAEADQFEELVVRLWNKLLPTMRSEFRFKLSFDPDEAVQESLHFALVPSSILPRWPRGQRITEGLDGEPATSVAGQRLADSDAGRFDSFVTSLELSHIKFADIGLIGKACELSEEREPIFKVALAALRLLAKLQPNPQKGLSVKTPLAKIVVRSPGPRSLTELLVLRNLDWSPFSATGVELSELKTKCEESIQTSSSLNEKCDFVLSIFEEEMATKYWRALGCEVLSVIGYPAAKEVANAAWNVLLTNRSTGIKLLQAVPMNILDSAMAETRDLPTIDDALSLCESLAKQKYYHAEANLLTHHHDSDMIAALEIACLRDRELYSDIAIKTILDRFSHVEKIDAALAIDDVFVLNSACEAVAAAPSLLGSYSLCNKRVQVIWKTAFSTSPDAWRIDQTVRGTQDRIFESLNDCEIDSTLLIMIMNTQLGDWSNHVNRSEIMNLLPRESQLEALRRTAIGWVEAFPQCKENNSTVSGEALLAQEIASLANFEALVKVLSTVSFDRALDEFFDNAFLTDSHFLELLARRRCEEHVLTCGEAERAGRLAFSRNWRSASRKLLSKCGAYGDMRPFFIVCTNHLSSWDRLFHGLSKPTTSELTNQMLDIAIDLYPSGPMEGDVWYRSEGDPASIYSSGNGRDQWRKAIRMIGHGGPVTAKKLIEQMQADYPYNEKLTYLKEKM